MILVPNDNTGELESDDSSLGVSVWGGSVVLGVGEVDGSIEGFQLGAMDNDSSLDGMGDEDGI